MTPLTLARRQVRRAWVIYYGSLLAGCALAGAIGTWLNLYWATLPLSLIIGAVVVLVTGGRLERADHELARAERFAAEQASRDRHPAGKGAGS